MWSMSTYHHGNLRTALLRSAGQALEKEGVAGLSLRDAARRAGVSHNAPYRHFADRDALLAALAAEGYERLAEMLQKASAREMGEAYVRFALENPERFRLMFGLLGRDPGLREAAGRTHALLVSAMGAVPNPELAAAAAWSLVHGLAHLVLDGQLAPVRGRDRDAFVRQVLGVVRFAQRSA
jgi:AcrR family transcriptional regulator